MLWNQSAFWWALGGLVLFVATAMRPSRFRALSLNLAAAALAVLLFLTYRWLDTRNIEHFDPDPWSEPHPIVGNLPRPNQVLHWTRTVGFTDVFDITVTTNAYG